MTAVQGIELLPPRESEVSPKKDVKNKGDNSSFKKLLTRKKDENPDLEETKEVRVKIKPEKAESPVNSTLYSAKKIASLIEMGKDEGLIEPTFSVDLSVLKETTSPNEDISLDIDFILAGNSYTSSETEESQDALELISRFLRGELSGEELEALTALEENEIAFPEIASKGNNPLRDLIVGESKDEENPALKGFLTEEGELLYFEEAASSDNMGKIKNSKSLSSLGESKKSSKAVIEINVSDLRQDKSKLVSGENQEKVVFNSGEAEVKSPLNKDFADNLEADLSDDLLSTPAEKMFSAEGAGGKLQAPVSREVSRMFQDYMRDTGNRDLVKKIDFILKDNNSGEIKLILKPEALGNVRINLSLNENHIAGKIFVDNSSVRDVFLNNMDQLTAILEENGYEDASIEVWVGQENRDGRNPDQNEPGEEEKSIRSAQGIKRFDESVPASVVMDGSVNGEVNLII